VLEEQLASLKEKRNTAEVVKRVEGRIHSNCIRILDLQEKPKQLEKTRAAAIQEAAVNLMISYASTNDTDATFRHST